MYSHERGNFHGIQCLDREIQENNDHYKKENQPLLGMNVLIDVSTPTLSPVTPQSSPFYMPIIDLHFQENTFTLNPLNCVANVILYFLGSFCSLRNGQINR